jgi:hypothetical protein
VNPKRTLFLWRSVASERASGATLCFFLSDNRLEIIWRSPRRYAQEFKRIGIAAAVEIDYSLWTDAPLAEQVLSVYKTRVTSRIFQGSGLHVIPNLNWSDERSFPFSFAGIPVGAPVCMTECRTPGSNDDDRRAFLRRLAEGVKQVQPQHVCIYGGQEHRYWLADRLPAGPTYTLLEAWTSARGKIRAAERRELRNKNQLTFGGETWAAEDQRAA